MAGINSQMPDALDMGSGAYNGRLEKSKMVGAWQESGRGWPLVIKRKN